ncbi:MAG: class I SAM-dependent methyltransferase [bacterium]|nr:class I SAM-dependent methyltransferase [bacterium]
MFAYTCSFSVAAVAGKAEVAVSVDTAKACLVTGRVNFELNGLALGGGKIRAGGCAGVATEAVAEARERGDWVPGLGSGGLRPASVRVG